MVGVPGKFVGCNTCHDRKLKCDNQRPQCKKCIKTGRECGGYERPRVFIVGTPEEQGRCSSHPHRSISLHAAKGRKPPQSVKGAKSVSQVAQALSPLDHVPYGPANQIQLLALYANALSLEPLHQSRGASVPLPSLLDYLPDLAGRSSALDSALRALCLIHIGVTKKDGHLVKESILHNTQAMGKVRLATINEKTAANIETLAASICLYLYEKVACTVEKAGAWRILFRGSSLLVRARGPASYKCYPDHHFFVELFRNEAVFDAMSLRKATFLAEPDWRTMPWENIPKTDIDHLIDIQVFLPRIFELEEQLEKSPSCPDRAAKAKKLLKKCGQIDKMFDDWFTALHSKSDKPLFWSCQENIARRNSAQKLGFDLCCVYTTYLDFLDLRTAFLHLYYWAGLTLFYRTMQNIHQLCYDDNYLRPSNSPEPFTAAHSSLIPVAGLQPPSSPAPLSHQFISPLPSQSVPAYGGSYPIQPTPSPPSSYGHTSPAQSLISDYNPVPPLDAKYSEDSIVSMAHNICRSLPYVLDHTLHELGPDNSTWPIWCALQVFKRQGYGEQTNWCREMMEMWGREGWKFATQMGRIDWIDSRSSGS